MYGFFFLEHLSSFKVPSCLLHHVALFRTNRCNKKNLLHFTYFNSYTSSVHEEERLKSIRTTWYALCVSSYYDSLTVRYKTRAAVYLTIQDKLSRKVSHFNAGLCSTIMSSAEPREALHSGRTKPDIRFSQPYASFQVKNHLSAVPPILNTLSHTVAQM